MAITGKDLYTKDVIGEHSGVQARLVQQDLGEGHLRERTARSRLGGTGARVPSLFPGVPSFRQIAAQAYALQGLLMAFFDNLRAPWADIRGPSTATGNWARRKGFTVRQFGGNSFRLPRNCAGDPQKRACSLIEMPETVSPWAKRVLFAHGLVTLHNAWAKTACFAHGSPLHPMPVQGKAFL